MSVKSWQGVTHTPQTVMATIIEYLEHLPYLGEGKSAPLSCREVVNSRKAVNKIYAAKANLNSVQLQMKGQLAQVNFLSNILLSRSPDNGDEWPMPYFIMMNIISCYCN